jgi:uncharacterized radical SAM superfamily protein
VQAKVEQFQNIRTMLQIVMAVHVWEAENLPELETSSGRFIFLNLLSYFCNHANPLSDSTPLKSIYQTDRISEKSIRNKLKEFNEQGLIQFVSLSEDMRSKCAVPTDLLIRKIINYAEQVNYIVRSHYYLVDIVDRDEARQNDKNNAIAMVEQNHQGLTDNLKHYLNNKSAAKLKRPSALLTKAERVALFAFQI